jgi:hypothetical protein
MTLLQLLKRDSRAVSWQMALVFVAVIGLACLLALALGNSTIAQVSGLYKLAAARTRTFILLTLPFYTLSPPLLSSAALCCSCCRALS